MSQYIDFYNPSYRKHTVWLSYNHMVIVIFFSLLIYSAVVGSLYYSKSKKISINQNLESEIEELNVQIDEIDSRLYDQNYKQSLEKKQALLSLEIEQIENSLNKIAGENWSKVSFSQNLIWLDKIDVEGVWLTEFYFESNHKIRLEGYAMSLEAISQYVQSSNRQLKPYPYQIKFVEHNKAKYKGKQLYQFSLASHPKPKEEVLYGDQ